MAGGFDSFVILGAMRTGSNLLEELLGSYPGIVCHGELFNPAFVGRRGQTAHLGIDLAARDVDPLRLLAAMRASGGLPGFRLFHDHDPRVLAHVLADPRCAKLVLTRNPLESYVSLQIAATTDQWRLTNARNLRRARAHFDADGFAQFLDTQQAFQRQILHALQTSGQTAFFIHYEDLGDVAVLNGLAGFLGIPARLERLEPRLKPQNPEPLAEKVDNPAEMAAALARMDPFGLSRTPNFEPRRGPGIAGFRAAAVSPLLFLPMRAGPEASILRWMAALDDVAEEALPGGFGHRGLAEWMQARPGHRAFSVLRHPVPRAWAAFEAVRQPGRYPRICAVLRRNHGLVLPDGGEEAGADPGQLRADFLGFLGFLRANLAGQTAVRVDPLWARQLAVLQGQAQVRPPDRLLREDGAAEGLEAIAQTVGRPAPPPPVLRDWPELAAIHDDEIEAAARAAYGLDYLTFGFGRWR
jgi:LPS sulfotransferase NodH